MSAVHDVYLLCDSCQAPSAAVAEGAPSTWEARADAKDQGWHYSKSRDICQVCWAAGKR